MHPTLKTALERSFPPASRMHLGLHHHPVSPQLHRRSSRLLRRSGHHPPGVWDRKLVKENLGLVLVDIHEAGGAERTQPHPRGHGCGRPT